MSDPLVPEFGVEACSVSQWEVLVPAHWSVELILISLVGGPLSLDVIRGGCVPEGSSGSLFADGWDCVPTSFVVLSWGFSALMGGPDFSKMVTSRGVHTNYHS